MLLLTWNFQGIFMEQWASYFPRKSNIHVKVQGWQNAPFLHTTALPDATLQNEQLWLLTFCFQPADLCITQKFFPGLSATDAGFSTPDESKKSLWEGSITLSASCGTWSHKPTWSSSKLKIGFQHCRNQMQHFFLVAKCYDYVSKESVATIWFFHPWKYFHMYRLDV